MSMFIHVSFYEEKNVDNRRDKPNIHYSNFTLNEAL